MFCTLDNTGNETCLINDTILTSYLSQFKNNPSVFNKSAPENVPFPYLIFEVSGRGSEDSVIDEYSVSFSVYDHNYTDNTVYKIVIRLEQLFDRVHLSDSYFDTIRFKKETGSYMNHEDPRAKHFVFLFNVRAGRSGWMQTL